MPITAEDLTRQNVLKVKAEADDERMVEAEDRLDLYMDDFEEIVDTKLRSLFVNKIYDRLKLSINGSQNITKRVINEISIIYTEEPTRTTDPPSDRYAEIEAETRLDLKMKKVNRYTNLLNQTIVKVGAREDRLMGWQIVYDILTPDMTMVIQNEEDPTKLDGIIYMNSWKDTRGNEHSEYHSWHVDGYYIVYDEDKKIKETKYDESMKGEDSDLAYPYKNSDGKFIIPFVVFHRTEPDWDFWDRDSGRDLINATIAVHWKMTLFDYYFKVSSFKQIYVIGDIAKVPQDQLSDPGFVYSVPAEANAQIGVLDIQANLKQLQEAIQFQIGSIINNYGISSDAFALSVPELSGRALLIKNRSLLQMINDQLPLYRDSETELFEVTRVVNNAWPKNFTKIDEKATFSIDYKEITFQDEPKDELELKAMRLKAGLISLGQFYLEENPDAGTIEEAEEIIKKNFEELGEILTEIPEVDAAINVILKSNRTTNNPNPEGDE